MATQPSLHDPDLEAGIAVGLVLHLDPKELTIRGATSTCDLTRRVQGYLLDLWRRAATYVDRILKGAQPADLSIDSRRSSNW